MNNHRKSLSFFCAIVFSSLLSTSCAIFSVENENGETADIADYAEDAIATARIVGTDQTLVVFDIDNTLLAMEQDLGSDQWYEWQKEATSAHPCDARLVTDRLAVQGALYYGSAMRPTQADAAEIVRSIQEAGVSVIALTSRGVSFRLQTFRELRRNGFDMRRTAIGPDGGWDEDFIPVHGSRPARFEDGVFLTAGQHKGEMLKDLLDKTNTPMPHAILMLDDKQSNLDAITETFGALGVPVRAWRYSGEDNTVAGFDEDLSDEMLEELLPAFQTIQKVLGTDHYELPENIRPGPDCKPSP
jgi:hypothetical protein